MQTPGAAIVCAAPVGVAAKFEKFASESSAPHSPQVGALPAPPGRPSVSDTAVTVRASGYAAGTSGVDAKSKSQLSLPAATTFRTSAAVAAHTASCIGSVVVVQDWIGSPCALRLMFSTLMFLLAALAVTQSMPQTTLEVVPSPFESSTLTAQTFVPGTTPTTPAPLFAAAIEPATWVP
jgi:hypothetical protein